MTRLRHLRSTRVRAALALGAVLAAGVSGTYALWTDTVPVSGVTISSGVLDLKVNTLDAVPAYTDLNLTGMVPGNTVAGILTVRNAGTIPLTYYATAAATNADGKGLGAALVVKVTADSAVTGTAPARTCAGAALATTGTTFAGNLVGTPATQRAWPLGCPRRCASRQPCRPPRPAPSRARRPTSRWPSPRASEPMSPRRVLDGAGHLALSLGAVIGALCLVVTVAGVSFGIRPVIFLSGSMSPAIPAGSLALSRSVPAADLRPGDVVSVPAGDRQVTHRIVDITHHGGSATLRLRGDANARTDDRSYEIEAAPRVLGSVPRAGVLLAWLSRTPGVFVLAGYATLLLALVLRGRPGFVEESTRALPRVREVVARSREEDPAAGGAHLDPGVRRCNRPGLRHPLRSPSSGRVGRPVSVSGSSVGTYTVPAPATFTCGALGVLSVTFNWTAVAGATNYTLHYGAGGALTKAVTGTSTTVVAAISGGTAWLQANRNFGSTTWVSAPSQTRTYTVAASALQLT